MPPAAPALAAEDLQPELAASVPLWDGQEPSHDEPTAIGIADAGTKLQALCEQAARQAESVLHTHLAQATDGSPDLYDLERAIGRVVRSVFRVARGIKPTVVCLLGDSPAPPSEDLLS